MTNIYMEDFIIWHKIFFLVFPLFLLFFFSGFSNFTSGNHFVILAFQMVFLEILFGIPEVILMYTLTNTNRSDQSKWFEVIKMHLSNFNMISSEEVMIVMNRLIRKRG